MRQTNNDGVTSAEKQSERDNDELTPGGRRKDDDERTSMMKIGTGGRIGARRQDGDA